MNINPFEIPREKLPLIILTDDRRSLFGFLIKQHSKGNYSHICEMHRPGYVATQDFTGYKEKPIADYMKPYIFMKFWSYKGLMENTRRTWKEVIQVDLDAPWIRRRYDLLGIIGHLLRIPWLNNPHLKYCYEAVVSHINDALKVNKPKQGTPSGLNESFKGDDRFETYGYWFSD